MVVGILLMQWIFASDWIHSFISSLVTYLLCLFFPRKYLGIAVFVWAMGFMTVCHLYRMYVSYMSGIFDFTGTQMVLTMKLTSFAYNLYDGTADKKNVNENNYEGSKAKVLLSLCLSATVSISLLLSLSLSLSLSLLPFPYLLLLTSVVLCSARPPPGL
jgi:hypothetical protein